MAAGYLYGWDAVNSKWVKMVCDADGYLKVDPGELFENPPIEDESKKGPTSEWAFDHADDADAHHARFTDLEARTACKLNGTLYWSCPGISFISAVPATDDIIRYAGGWVEVISGNVYLSTPVNLPDGATVTGAIVRGNAGAEDTSWYLYRITLSTRALGGLASAVINTEDTTITLSVIDNTTYGYFFASGILVADDEIYGARITYTL